MAEFKLPCIVFKQRGTPESPMFLLFEAPAAQILRWAAIQRRQDSPTGSQRKLSKARVSAIRTFFNKDARNTIPTAIVVTLQVPAEALAAVPGVPAELSAVRMLQFAVPDDAADADKPGLVIDGQHRLSGISRFSPESKVPVVALLNVDDTEKAFQFLVINNKAAKVHSDLIKTLALDYQEAELATRLEGARVTLHDNLRFISIVDADDESPFRGIINVVSAAGDQAARFVPPAAIESSISVIQQKKIRELDDDDTLCEVFYSIWRPIKATWPRIWNSNTWLLTKVGIVCMTTYVIDMVVSKFDYGDLDITDPDAVSAFVRQILTTQTADFWAAEWRPGSYDTKVGRDLVVRSLAQAARNIRANDPWKDGIEMFET